MSRLESQIATHVVRSHRSLRRRVPEFAALARMADGPATEQVRLRAARNGVQLIDRHVLAQADVEDILVDRYLGGRPSRGDALRLQPQHDALRDASAHLHDYIEDAGERVDVGGMLHGVGDLLGRHLEDEWRVLVPALSALDGEADCTACESLVTTSASRPSARLYLPLSFTSSQHRLTRPPPWLAARVCAAASVAAHRVARRLRVAIRPDLRFRLDLHPVVQSQHVGLYAGRLDTSELETVVSPVDFELVLSPLGEEFTELAAHHTLVPRRPLPADAPAREVTDAVFHAAIGELAGIAGDRSRASSEG